MTFNDLGVQKVKQNEFHAFDILLDPSQKRKPNTKFQIEFTYHRSNRFSGFNRTADLCILPLTPIQKDWLIQVSIPIPMILVAPIKTSGLSDNLEGFAVLPKA